MKNVLHLIDTGGPGGAETVFLNLAAGMRETFRPICVVSRDGWLADALRARGIEPLIVSAKGSFNFPYLRRLVQIVRQHRIDMIVAHLYGSAIYGSLTGILSGTPVISILHGQTDIAQGDRLAGCKRFIVKTGSDRVVFVSGRLQQDLSSMFQISAARGAVIPNGVDVARFSSDPDNSLRRELGLPADAYLIGAIGNIRAPKAYDVLLRAAAILATQSQRYHFAIVGQGSGALFDNLLAIRKELGLEKTVSFLGLRANVPTLLRNFDAYVLSSSTEGFSIACIEAMAAGVPVIATRSGGPEEIIEDGESGLLVPTQDPASLAAAIQKVYENPDLAARVAQRGRERVHENFTLRRMLERYTEVFHQVIQHNA